MRAAREQRGLSVREAARLGGVSNTTWARFEESGQLTPRMRVAVAQAFGWSTNWPTESEPQQVNHADPDLPEVVDGLSRAVESLLLDAAARRPRIADFDAKLAELAGELVRLANRIDLLETRLSQRPGE